MRTSFLSKNLVISSHMMSAVVFASQETKQFSSVKMAQITLRREAKGDPIRSDELKRKAEGNPIIFIEDMRKQV
ncbi:hypothetical protein P4S95_27600 [Aneurinibacillus aneurinilyticus]|uniref:Uncharacterized protein n=1 Tax=Aneurinibacillus aneurinilyticus TaxID=1391 RepID=A0A848D3S1_ANEAE|nr:hypothetical protein [Aneurinibacillus aneurinilyticus]MED0673908.1 hypothetical protein [Aneurinibacillus aneurinilyticus]NMF00341.1 hypothetical protein [Aneurinibacillus aneurinilyticus]